jgi:hypothetical protein
MMKIERPTLEDRLTPQEFAGVLGQLRQAISGSVSAKRIRLPHLVARRLCGREALTIGFLEETNESLAKLGLALAPLPTTLVLVDIDAVYNWKRPPTKKVDEILGRIKQDKALVQQWFNSLREAYETEDEDDDGDSADGDDN